jgi:hypothetical protein
MPHPVPVLFDDPIAARKRAPSLSVRHLVQHCRWSASGFPVGWPVWLDSAGFEWTCWREGGRRSLPDPRECVTCPHWETP